jgi:hypothetical protein
VQDLPENGKDGKLAENGEEHQDSDKEGDKVN